MRRPTDEEIDLFAWANIEDGKMSTFCRAARWARDFDQNSSEILPVPPMPQMTAREVMERNKEYWETGDGAKLLEAYSGVERALLDPLVDVVMKIGKRK